MKTLALFCTLWLSGCAATPQGITAVQDFDLERYLGTWYEMARLDHRFERGLHKVSATYSKRSDGGIDILNRGYDNATASWKEAKGRAYFVKNPAVASLKVTFFWPFYAGYNVIELDREHYSYALVCGPDRTYLWILSRQKTLAAAVAEQLVAKADTLGFATDQLIFVNHQD